MKKKIDFKDKKYIFPLIALPFVIFIGWQVLKLVKEDKTEAVNKEELLTSLGEVGDSILSKNDAYNEFYRGRENRSMIGSLEDETDSLLEYSKTLNDKQKRYIDSIDFENKKANNEILGKEQNSYYNPNIEVKQNKSDKDETDYQRSLEIIKMLNENPGNEKKNEKEIEDEKEEDPIAMMRKQILLMDSIENSKNPEYQKEIKAAEKLRANEEAKNAYLNSTFKVSKETGKGQFNHISRKKKNNIIKAVIDENIKGYLGSRIRIRLLEEVFVGETKMPQGTILYALISGFSLQRVNLNVVSVVLDGDIYPINLSVYDNDGMKGLYVPRSAFREMLREIGSNTNYLQGASMGSENQNFYASFLSGVLNSASKTIAKVIRSNKVRLKYNSYVYLINEKQFNKRRNENNKN